jgi:hypothetical protein
MATFQQIKTSIVEQWKVPGGNEIAFFLISKPGGGKSACAREAAKEILAYYGLPYEQYDSDKDNVNSATVVEFNGSLRDPVDILGIPITSGDYSNWKAPAEFWALRAGNGVRVLILEEMSDSSMPMQNALCRVKLDRYAGNLKLTDKLFIVATGNRTEDKSGANRISSKLANRVRWMDFTENLNDWLGWADDNDIDPILRQFLRFKPDALSDFDVNQRANPTPRSWARVAKIPTTLPQDLYALNVFGEVGEGRGAEYVGFRQIYDQLPDYEEIIAQPRRARLPDRLDALYATAGMVAKFTTKDTFDRAYEYLARFATSSTNGRDLVVMCVNDIKKKHPQIMQCEAFRKQFVTDYADVITASI